MLKNPIFKAHAQQFLSLKLKSYFNFLFWVVNNNLVMFMFWLEAAINTSEFLIKWQEYSVKMFDMFMITA